MKQRTLVQDKIAGKIYYKQPTWLMSSPEPQAWVRHYITFRLSNVPSYHRLLGKTENDVLASVD